MFRAIKEEKRKKKNNDESKKIINMAIIMFISFSILNIFLIFNFINILSGIKI